MQEGGQVAELYVQTIKNGKYQQVILQIYAM